MRPIDIPPSVLERGSKDAARALRFQRTGVLAKSDDDEMASPALQGYAARYGKLFSHKGTAAVFVRGAFKKSIGDGQKIDLIHSHDDSVVYGRADVLHDDEGVAFRFLLPKTPRGYALRKMAISYAMPDISVGARILKSAKQMVDGIDVLFITEAKLEEISLVKDGAVPHSNATVIDAAKEPSFRDSVNRGRVLLDSATLEVLRNLNSMHRNAARLESLVAELFS